MLVHRYTKDLSTEHVDGANYRMLRTLGYQIGLVRWCACKGDITDFSSTPGFYDLFVKPWRVNNAGAMHDSPYRTGFSCHCDPVKTRKITRAQADRAWRLIAQHGHGANFMQAWAGWLGLRLVGWVVWNKYRRNDKALLDI